MNITLAQAETAIEAAKAKATELNLLMNICIVDSGANLVAFARMDGAWPGSIDVSTKKAKTSAWFFMNSGDLGSLSQPGGSLYNIEHSNGGLITFPGGIPIKGEHGKTIGAIGVSGSTVENDHVVAQSGADAVKQENRKKEKEVHPN
ncbi:MAG: heme-binding protein [Chitinophagaceae bacterium]|nr:heme-binding protein [Chitinophagaceae bacterium]